MKLIESIKLLKPAERFKALIFIGILSAATTLTTVWLKGNPCDQITAQYSQQLDNYAKLAATNNYLMNSDVAKQQTIIRLHALLAQLDSAGKLTETQWVAVTTPIETRVVNQVRYVYTDSHGDSMQVAAAIRPAPPALETRPRTATTRKLVKVTKNMSQLQRSLLDSAMQLTNKYITNKK
jgi:hypothetical protein